MSTLSLEQPSFSTADLRSNAQDSKRDATRKHKWALGAAVATPGRAAEKPRPYRPGETNQTLKRREDKAGVAALAHGAKLARKHDMLEGTAAAGFSNDSAADTNSDECDGTPSPPADAGVMYSFDAAKGPSHGSQILNVALAKAVEKFEEKETVKLVKNEYDVLDSEGESVGVSMPVAGKKNGGGSKAKGKKAAVVVASVPDADEDYEFV